MKTNDSGYKFVYWRNRQISIFIDWYWNINVKGAAIGTVAAYIVASTLNVIAVKDIHGVKIDITMTLLNQWDQQ